MHDTVSKDMRISQHYCYQIKSNFLNLIFFCNQIKFINYLLKQKMYLKMFYGSFFRASFQDIFGYFVEHFSMVFKAFLSTD